MTLSGCAVPDQPTDLLIRMFNLVGAAVDITGRKDRSTWTCHGCGDSHGSHFYLDEIRNRANAHAGECRAAYHRQ